MAHKLLYIILVTSFLFSSCKSFDFSEDISFVSSDATYAIPLINTQIKLADLIESDSISELEVYPDDHMVLRYFGDLGRKHIDEIFANIPLIPYTATDTFNIIDLILGNNNLVIKQAQLKAGTISLGYVSEHEQNVSVEFQIAELTKDGQVFSHTIATDYQGSAPVSVSALDIPLEGYSLNVDNNQLHLRYIATKEDGTRDTVSSVNMLIQGLEFTYMEGYWGSDFFNVERDTIVIDVFDQITGGNLFFTDPKVTVTVQNSFGFPVRSKVEVAQVISSDGIALPLESTFVTEGFDINYPTLDQVGQTMNTYFAFDNINSNIDDIIGSSPKLFDYKFDGLANPNADPSIIGFMTDSSFFEIKVAVELPLSGFAQDYALEQTFDVDFSKYDNVNWVELKVVTQNSIPFTVQGQMYFEDENGFVLDSTFANTQTIVEGASVNDQGFSATPTNNTLFVLIEKDKFNKIRSSKKLRLNTLLMTSGGVNTPVTFTNKDALDLRVGMKLGLDKL